jgi:hypothetical protein
VIEPDKEELVAGQLEDLAVREQRKFLIRSGVNSDRMPDGFGPRKGLPVPKANLNLSLRLEQCLKTNDYRIIINSCTSFWN